MNRINRQFVYISIDTTYNRFSYMTVFVKRWFITIFNASVNVWCSVKVGMKLPNIETPLTRNFIPHILLNVQDFYFLVHKLWRRHLRTLDRAYMVLMHMLTYFYIHIATLQTVYIFLSWKYYQCGTAYLYNFHYLPSMCGRNDNQRPSYCPSVWLCHSNAETDRNRLIRLLSTTGSAGEAHCTWCIFF
jgi:hypothetical protein